MKLRKLLSALLLAAGVVFVAGRQEAGGADTPSEVLLKVHRAIRNLDFDTCAKLTYGQANVDVRKMEKFVAGMTEAARNGDENAEMKLNELKTSLRKWRIEITDEKIDGDLAVVDIVDVNALSGKDGPSKQQFRKIDGEWKLIDTEDYRKELAARKATSAGPVDSPSEVMRKCMAAVKALDYAALAKLSCGGQKAAFLKIAEKIAHLKEAARNDDPKAQNILDEAQAKVDRWTLRITGEKIDGDLALVNIESSGNPAGAASDGPSFEAFKMVDGQWKWMNAEDYRKALAARKTKAARQGDSPSEVLMKIVAATRKFDLDTLARLCWGEQKAQVEQLAGALAQVEEAARNGDERAKRTLAEEKAKMANLSIEITDEKIDGDLAVVDGVVSGHPSGKNGRDSQQFRRVGGEWKAISLADYQKALAARKAKAAKPVDGPSEVVVKYAAAARELNYNAVASLCHGDLRAEFRKLAEAQERLRTAAAAGDRAAQLRLDDERRNALRIQVAVGGEKIDGDLAEVDIVVSGADDDGNGPTKAYLKLVDGRWKVISDEEYAREKAAR